MDLLERPSVIILASLGPVFGTKIDASTVFAGMFKVCVQEVLVTDTVTVAACSVLI
jgi:hypothetical protein